MENFIFPYARAIYDVAKEHDKVQDWLNLLENLSAVMSKDLLRDFIADPKFSTRKKAELIANSLASAKYPRELVRLIELMVENNRSDHMNLLLDLVQKQHDDAIGVKRVRIVQALELDESYKAKILTWLSNKFEGQVIAVWSIDKDLIGGFMVEIGDTVYDYSIRSRLNQIKENLM